MPKNPTVAANNVFYSRESFAQVPTRKSLLLRRKRRSFAFGKTTALLFTIVVVSMAAQALNERADSADDTQPQASPSALLTATIAQIAATEERIPNPTNEPESEPDPEPEPEPTPAVRIYDIPLTEELQAFTFYLCEDYGTDYEMVLALMDRESDYTASAISKTNDYGIMQINKVNHEWLKEELGIEDFLKAEQNILAGIRMLAGLTAKYEDPHLVLMAYNCGENGAKKLWKQGKTTSQYSRSIMARAEELRKEAEECQQYAVSQRPLKDPKSIERGYGPDCWREVKAKMVKEEEDQESEEEAEQ